jgi:hypothetical protein
MSGKRQLKNTRHDRTLEESKIVRHERRALKRNSSNQDQFPSANEVPPQIETLAPEGRRTVQVPIRIAVGARIFGTTLDDKLANGCTPETSRLLAARAQLINASANRRKLAENWLDLIICAREARELLSPKIPLIRERIIEARTDIESLADALRAPIPTVHGVAMARSLLVDGAGPIYNRDCSVDLGSALWGIIATLDPLTA